jgi:hypothetical protein
VADPRKAIISIQGVAELAGKGVRKLLAPDWLVGPAPGTNQIGLRRAVSIRAQQVGRASPVSCLSGMEHSVADIFSGTCNGRAITTGPGETTIGGHAVVAFIHQEQRITRGHD